MKKRLPFIDWRKRKCVSTTRSILDFLFGFVWQEVSGGKRDHGIWALWELFKGTGSLNRLEEKTSEDQVFGPLMKMQRSI